MNTKAFSLVGEDLTISLGIGRENQISFLKTLATVKFSSQNCQKLTLVYNKIITD